MEIDDIRVLEQLDMIYIEYTNYELTPIHDYNNIQYSLQVSKPKIIILSIFSYRYSIYQYNIITIIMFSTYQYIYEPIYNENKYYNHIQILSFRL